MTTQAFATSFRRVPAPAGPTRSVRWPIASKTGARRSSASSGPEARTTSAPCSAGAFVPRTGASTSTAPCSRASSAQRSVPSIPIVDACTHSTPSRAAGSARPATSRTASASDSIVSTTSRSRTAAARSSSRRQTATSRPASRRFAAIGAPIVPAPRTATDGTGAVTPAPARAGCGTPVLRQVGVLGEGDVVVRAGRRDGVPHAVERRVEGRRVDRHVEEAGVGVDLADGAVAAERLGEAPAGVGARAVVQEDHGHGLGRH